VGPRNHIVDRCLDPPREGHFWGWTCDSHCNVSMHEYIAHCLPATAGIYASATQVVDRCISCHEGLQEGDAAKLLWTRVKR